MIRELFDMFCGRVLDGPFKGMKYISNSVGSAYWPKVLGTYEKEISFLLDDFLNDKNLKLINVGAAEGYFSVGCKYLSKDLEVVSFEAEESGRSKIKELCSKNNIHIDIKGFCSLESLKAEFENDKNCIVFMDVEGAEVELLNISEIETLKKCSIVVEVHDNFVEGAGATLEKRFSKTHKIQKINAEKRQLNDCSSFFYSFCKCLSKIKALDLLNEHRYEKAYWFYMKPIA